MLGLFSKNLSGPIFEPDNFPRKRSIRIARLVQPLRLFNAESNCWWSRGGSNSWPPACKAGALPAELRPPISRSSGAYADFRLADGALLPHLFILASTRTFTSSELVGQGGFEPPTSPLSGVRSNQLSYRPWCSVQHTRSSRTTTLISCVFHKEVL